MKTVALLLGLMVLAGTAVPAPVPIRIMTWNLQWFPGGRTGATREAQDKHIAAVRESIQKLSPDILLLQEAGSAGALEEALRPLGPEWKVIVVSRFMQGGFLSGQQIAIASRIAAEAVWSEPWAAGWAGPPRGYAYASFVINGKRLGAYALHLKSNLGDAQGNTSKREDSIEQLLAHIGAPDNRVKIPDALVIAGDFNTDDPDAPGAHSPAERTFGLLKKAGFDWAFAGLPVKDRISCPGHGRYPDACFDHFFTKGLGSPAAAVANVQGSDHFPVTVDVLMK